MAMPQTWATRLVAEIPLDISRRIAIQRMVYFSHDAIERCERVVRVTLFMASAGVVPFRARADPPGPLNPSFRFSAVAFPRPFALLRRPLG